MTRFPWIVLVAYAVLWFAPTINRWIDRRPRPRPPAPTPERPPIRGTLLRPGRELDRGDRW